MALKTKYLVEAARGAALAAHSAAGLADAASCREAARLLRSSEALARTAVAVLSARVSPKETVQGVTPDACEGPARGADGAAGPTNPPGNGARRRRRRPRKNSQPQSNQVESPAQEGLAQRGLPRVGASAQRRSQPSSAMDVDGCVSATGTFSEGTASRRPSARVLRRHETQPTPPEAPPKAAGASSSTPMSFAADGRPEGLFFSFDSPMVSFEIPAARASPIGIFGSQGLRDMERLQ